MSGEHYLIIKRDLYYRPNSQGYTGIRDQAGRYTIEFAKAVFKSSGGECRWVHENDAKEFTSAAFDDLVIKHLLDQRDALRVELVAAKGRPAHFSMSSAPRDGTEILAFRDNGCSWETMVVWWAGHGAVYPWSSYATSYPEDRLDCWQPISYPRDGGEDDAA